MNEFPTPEWPPIQDVRSVDITGVRRDGGVDLVIVASQPLDDSPATRHAIREKVSYYLAVIESEEFQAEFVNQQLDQTRIEIHCNFPIHPNAQRVIEECQANSEAHGVILKVVQGNDTLGTNPRC